MKRRDVIALLICLMAMSLTLAVKYWPRGVPLEECSETYRALKDNPHLSVSYIKGLRIDDTTAINATLLHALDTVGWNCLMHYFGLPQEFIEFYNDTLQNLNQPANFHFYIEKDNPAKRPPPDSGPNPFVVANVKEHVFCIYDIKDVSQFNAIAYSEAQKLKN